MTERGDFNNLSELRDMLREIQVTCTYCNVRMIEDVGEDGRIGLLPVWKCPKCKQRLGLGMEYPQDDKMR